MDDIVEDIGKKAYPQSKPFFYFILYSAILSEV